MMKNNITLLIVAAFFLSGTSPNMQPEAASNQRLHKVLIDISHGGKDPGAICEGTSEKDLAHEYGMALKEKLNASGINVVLSRTGDEFVTLARRAEIANNEKVDLLLSLHFNISDESEINGFRSHYKSGSENSLSIARLIHTKLSSSKLINDNGSGIGSYAILEKTKAPAVLLELGYLSNTTELELLKKPETKSEYAGMLSEAVIEYFETM